MKASGHWAKITHGQTPHIAIHNPEDQNFSKVAPSLGPESLVFLMATVEFEQSGWVVASAQVIFEEDGVCFINKALFTHNDTTRPWFEVEPTYQKDWSKESWKEGMLALTGRLLNHFFSVDNTPIT